MGNVDSRAKQEYGYLFLQTHKKIYTGGEEVTGTIYLRVDQAMAATNVQITVIGKEEARWEVETSNNSNDNFNNATTREIYQEKKEILNYNKVAFVFTDVVQPGDY